MSQAPVAAREPFNESSYLTALQTLGLAPPVDREAIRRAYRERVKLVHPDRVLDCGETGGATARVQEMNAAHAYALQHWQGFHLARRWNRARLAAQVPAFASWHEWLLLPVTMVYALTSIAAAAPFLVLARVPWIARAAWRSRPSAGLLWRFWLVLAPHLLTIALFKGLDSALLGAWVGLSFLIMISADIATLVTGEPHGLRRPLGKALDRLT